MEAMAGRIEKANSVIPYDADKQFYFGSETFFQITTQYEPILMTDFRNNNAGQLYVVATPIGHLDDITQRAIDTLQKCDYIAAEDTRHSARLLQQFNITTPVIAYHDHSNQQRRQQLLDWLVSGKSIALISDAGTPLVSDPGYALVKKAAALGIKTVPVPGACAFVAALSVAGLPSDRFLFEGFLPAKTIARQAHLDGLAAQNATLIFYESTHRIVGSLEAMKKAFGGDRKAVIGRELTKTFETILRGTLEDLAEQVQTETNQQRGEFVVLVQGQQKKSLSNTLDAAAKRTMAVLLEELPAGQAATIGARLTGARKRELYRWALNRKHETM